MFKWVFIIIIGVGAYMHFTSKTNETYLPPDANKTITNSPITQETEVQPVQQTQSREPTEDQCKSVGGRIISGMGCVVGAPENGNSNPNFSPSEVEAMCKQDGSRYEPAINACVSS